MLPGGAKSSVVGRSVRTLPLFWHAFDAKALEEILASQFSTNRFKRPCIFKYSLISIAQSYQWQIISNFPVETSFELNLTEAVQSFIKLHKRQCECPCIPLNRYLQYVYAYSNLTITNTHAFPAQVILRNKRIDSKKISIKKYYTRGRDLDMKKSGSISNLEIAWTSPPQKLFFRSVLSCLLRVIQPETNAGPCAPDHFQCASLEEDTRLWTRCGNTNPKPWLWPTLAGFSQETLLQVLGELQPYP